MLKRVVFGMVAVALVAALGVGGLWLSGQGAKPALAQGTEEYKSYQIVTVVGQGSTRIQPDIAQLSVGVETMAGSVSEAVQENEAKMKAILAALKAQGIAEKDIQTSNYSISIDYSGVPAPRTTGTETEPAKPQYRVSNMVSVKIRDLDKVGDVIDAVVEAGANNIWGVSFGLDDPKAAQAEARSKAMADAQARAAELAQLAKVQLGPVMSISETVGGGPVVYAVAERAMGGADSSISPGEVEITYQLQVSYYITP